MGRLTTAPLLAVAWVSSWNAGCGDNRLAPDSGPIVDAAAPDAGPTWGILGPDIELPLLPGFNHSAEMTVAVDGGDVVVAGVNLALTSADSFGTEVDKRVALWTSRDRGATFSTPYDLPTAYKTSDPVVRVGADGRFWTSVLRIAGESTITLASSQDSGDTWSIVIENVPAIDREWIAIDDAGSTVFSCALRWLARVSTDGVLLSSFQWPDESRSHCLAAYVDAAGFHFMNANHEIVRWDGTSDPVIEVAARDWGDASTWMSRVTGSIGPLGEGQWMVRNMKSTDGAVIMLETTTTIGSAVTQRQLSPPGVTAFLPAATMDTEGRLHVLWYESSGVRGVLRYTRSATSDLAGEFLAPYTIDPDACPGGDWYPYLPQEMPEPPGGRRLREYIDIAVEGNRAHIAWTHAPDPPSRIHATYVDLVDR